MLCGLSVQIDYTYAPPKFQDIFSPNIQMNCFDTGMGISYITQLIRRLKRDSVLPAATPDSSYSANPALGVFWAGSAFIIWGLSPICWKSLAAESAFEILMHRMKYFVYSSASILPSAFRLRLGFAETSELGRNLPFPNRHSL